MFWPYVDREGVEVLLLGSSGFTTERHAKQFKQLLTFFIIAATGNEGNIHADVGSLPFDSDFRENSVVGYTQGVVSLTIELIWEASEIANVWQCNGG